MPQQTPTLRRVGPKAQPPGPYKRTSVDDRKDAAQFRITQVRPWVLEPNANAPELTGPGIDKQTRTGPNGANLGTYYFVTKAALNRIRQAHSVVTDF